jgi:hypothetical protein
VMKKSVVPYFQQSGWVEQEDIKNKARLRKTRTTVSLLYVETKKSQPGAGDLCL